MLFRFYCCSKTGGEKRTNSKSTSPNDSMGLFIVFTTCISQRDFFHSTRQLLQCVFLCMCIEPFVVIYIKIRSKLVIEARNGFAHRVDLCNMFGVVHVWYYRMIYLKICLIHRSHKRHMDEAQCKQHKNTTNFDLNDVLTATQMLN